MSEPFLAEVRLFGFNFAPRGWAFCDGQSLPINQNQSLYSLLGTIYGGDGRTYFNLPDLRGRTPVHEGNGHRIGQKSGSETVTLTTGQMPSHEHTVKASNSPATQGTAAGHFLGDPVAAFPAYGPYTGTDETPLASAVQFVGGGQAHNNMQPYIAVTFCIALRGLFPSRN